MSAEIEQARRKRVNDALRDLASLCGVTSSSKAEIAEQAAKKIKALAARVRELEAEKSPPVEAKQPQQENRSDDDDGELARLSDADVERLLSASHAVDVNEAAFLSVEQGTAVVPERILIPVKDHDGMTLVKPARVGADALGLKVVSVRPKNAARAPPLPTVPATIMLLDVETALGTAVIDATYLTALRTAGGSAAATRAIANTQPRVLTVFGAGMQAREHIRTLAVVRPSLEVVYIVNRSAGRANALAAELGKLLHPMRFEVALLAKKEESEEKKSAMRLAVEKADIIVTATNSFEPLFRGAWLKPGAHLNLVGSYQPHMREVDDETMKRAKCVVLDTPGAAKSSGDICLPIASGALDPERQIKHVGAVLAAFRKESGGGGGDGGKSAAVQPPTKTARATESDITIFKSVGTAVQDVATAHAVLVAHRQRKKE